MDGLVFKSFGEGGVKHVRDLKWGVRISGRSRG